ncbi:MULTISPECIES: VanZ family protein [Microbacterium]|uniref:VanZ family protein n=1 Tax=Microbacterium TaxID=33882 RepID=UPI0013A57CC7|nr:MULTISPECIES: VanZ family protein [Microbacterium]
MSEIIRTRRRRVRAVAVLAAAAAVTLLTLGPRSLVAPARGAFLGLLADIAPLEAWFPGGDAERALNTAMFVPFGAALAMILSRRAWPIAILAGLAASTFVECLQASIPGRVPDLRDVVWNTVGAAIGAVAVTAVRLMLAAGRRDRQRGRVTRT